MNPSIDALLDLQVIDKQRLTLKRTREAEQSKHSDAERILATAQAAAAAAQAEVDKTGALHRQYQADIARCDHDIADARSKQMAAKTNKEYMAIINSIEQAKLEKGHREQSIKDLETRIKDLETKAATAVENVAKAKASLDQLAASSGVTEASPEEQELQRRYDDIKAKIDPAFLEIYERLVKAHHKMPLMRVDPATRSTVFGGVISHNQVEQIRMGKLVIDRNTNAILYLAHDRPTEAKAE
jgi:predicted  nucleic acid-binding Zn-ribbon protein